MGCDNFFLCEENSTYLLARLGWFCPVASEPVKPYFTRLLRVLTFCLGASKIVILKENGVVNGVVDLYLFLFQDKCKRRILS